MDSMFGKTIPLKKGSAVIQKQLGEGRQGVVYLAQVNGTFQALKMYKEEYLRTLRDARLFYDNLENNMMIGSPGSMFVWPSDITPYGSSFGYVMPLIPENYREFTAYQMRATFPDVRTRVDAMLHLTNAFRILHNKGFAYGDLNNGNFSIRPTDGDVLACDTDNITCFNSDSGIAGKMRYMAPEIVLGQKSPDKYTDRFSLSVLLFMLACKAHPLEGQDSTPACMIPSYEKRIYGSNPRFIFDRKDTSNGPIRGIHDKAQRLWEAWPEWFRTLFEISFSRECMTYHPETKSYESPRLMEKEWLEPLVHLRNSTAACPYCGNEEFVEGMGVKCSKCGRELPILSLLDNGKYAVPAVPGSVIYRGQAENCPDENYLDPIARVVTPDDRPAPPQQYGIRNVSDAPLAAVTSKGEERMLPPGATLPVKPGISIRLSKDRQIKIV